MIPALSRGLDGAGLAAGSSGPCSAGSCSHEASSSGEDDELFLVGERIADLAAGINAAEVAALDVSDVRTEPDGSGRVTVRHSKTDQAGAVAVLYIGKRTADAVSAYLAAAGHGSGALFRNSRGMRAGERMDAQSVRAAIARRLRAAGTAGRVSGHSLRRGAAASLVSAGASVAAV